MKLLVIFAFVLSVAFAARLSSKSTVTLDEKFLKKSFQDVKIELPEDMVEKIKEFLENNPEKTLEEHIRAGTIIAIINDYADKIFENLRKLLIRKSLDPMQLPDENLSVIFGHIDLTQGWLQELATVTRGGDLSVEYSTDTKNLKFIVPVLFETLLFTYDYHTVVTLLSISGGVDGNIKNVTADVVITFNFETLYAALDKMEIDAGKISVHFTGHDLIDWVTNAMTAAVTTFFKGFITSIVERILKNPAQEAIELFNSIIDRIFHATTPESTEAIANLLR